MDDLLTKGAMEPATGGAGLYSKVFIIAKHTGGLHNILNLKWFNSFMHTPVL